MTGFDLTPLMRSTVGFDQLTDMLDRAMTRDIGNGSSYPPYNIEKTGENSYRISMAVAGFSMADLDIVLHDNVLNVKGKIEKEETSKVTSDEERYLHRGIAMRSFEQRFQLADHIEVIGADMKNGLLNIDLIREIPEKLKPRKITIKDNEVIEN